jgi:hypothetical protein
MTSRELILLIHFSIGVTSHGSAGGAFSILKVMWHDILFKDAKEFLLPLDKENNLSQSGY